MNEQIKYYNKYYFVLKNALFFISVNVYTLFENWIIGFSKSSLQDVRQKM